MQQSIKRIGAFLLAILVWVATSSFTLSMHYCGTKMVSYSTLGKAKPCCKASAFQFSEQDNIVSLGMACCKDKQLEKESEDELTLTIAKADVELHQLLLLLPQLLDVEFNNEFAYLSNVNKQVQENLSPHYSRDRNVLFQVFLI